MFSFFLFIFISFCKNMLWAEAVVVIRIVSMITHCHMFKFRWKNMKKNIFIKKKMVTLLKFLVHFASLLFFY